MLLGWAVWICAVSLSQKKGAVMLNKWLYLQCKVFKKVLSLQTSKEILQVTKIQSQIKDKTVHIQAIYYYQKQSGVSKCMWSTFMHINVSPWTKSLTNIWLPMNITLCELVSKTYVFYFQMTATAINLFPHQIQRPSMLLHYRRATKSETRRVVMSNLFLRARMLSFKNVGGQRSAGIRITGIQAK